MRPIVEDHRGASGQGPSALSLILVERGLNEREQLSNAPDLDHVEGRDVPKLRIGRREPELRLRLISAEELRHQRRRRRHLAEPRLKRVLAVSSRLTAYRYEDKYVSSPLVVALLDEVLREAGSRGGSVSGAIITTEASPRQRPMRTNDDFEGRAQQGQAIECWRASRSAQI